jgi:hypothetical protein
MIVTSLLSACATVNSESAIGVCPPVVEYDAEFQTRAAEDVQALPEGSAIVEMLSDYAVMREQAGVQVVFWEHMMDLLQFRSRSGTVIQDQRKRALS